MNAALSSRLKRAGAVLALGALAIVVAAWACLALGAQFATAAFVLLIAIVFLSLLNSLPASLVVSGAAAATLNFFFVEPKGAFAVKAGADIAALVAFILTSVVVTSLASRVRALAKSEATLAEAAERKAAADALRASEYRYRNLFQAMAASFWELDFSDVGAILARLRAEGVKDYAAHFAAHPEIVREMMRATRVLDVNDQTVSLFFGGDRARVHSDVEPFWPDASNHVYAASVIAAVTRQPSYAAECRLRTADGAEFDTLFTACFAPETVAAGKLLIGVIDISERVRAQAALERLRAEFAHAARVSMLGELTASIAHEVNQPLAAISANAAAGQRWLDRPEPDVAEVRAIVDRIVADSARAGAIIARVRAMAMQRSPERAPFAINEAIGEALAFLRHELQAHGQEAVADLARGLPLGDADRTQIQQVIVNLVVNAMQAMSQGDKSGRIRVTSALSDKDICIAVEDDGPGLSPEHQARLFESFFTTKAGGMGMGLPICRTIVEAHGGRIEAANRPEGGARFAFTLPAQAGAAHT